MDIAQAAPKTGAFGDILVAMNWLHFLLGRRKPLTAEQRARALIKAVDAGGLPLNAAIVNDIARQLGLEVSSRARMEETIGRIREALGRV